MAESRPLSLLFRLFRTPLRLRRRYQPHPLPTGTSIVVYTCMPIANYAAASCIFGQDIPKHHTISWRRVDLYPSCFAYSGRLFDYGDGTNPIHCQQARQSSSTHVCQSQITQQQAVYSVRTFLNTIPYHGGESTSIPPVSPIQDASSTTATVPTPSIANRHVNRRLHMYANRKLRSSKLFERLGPSYTPYHMMAESRPLYLLLRLIRAPIRLQHRFHADPLHTATTIIAAT